jgi:exodeoxyribonuclease V alpha subunit
MLLAANGTVTVAVQAGESIAVYSQGYATISRLVGFPNYPDQVAAVGTVNNSQAVFGPYASGASIIIEATGGVEAQYEVGSAPVVKTGLIVRNAHHVNHGEPFETSESKESDFYFIETGEPETIISRTVELMTQRIPSKFGMDPMHDVQVLTPMRKNLLGTENLNDVIQTALNPSGPSLLRGCTHYRRGDRVMQMRNNYDKDVFNGDIGFIKEVSEEDHYLVILFDGRPVRYEQSELDEVVLAYACSIHKSQGSEYAAVIVLMHTQHYKLLQRNLLYTAITRGKKLVLVVGSSRAIGIAIRANQVRERRTALSSRLRE